MRPFACLFLFVSVLFAGCSSFMEKIVPAGNPTWKDVATAADKIHRGTPKWVVKMKLGTPTASSPRMWRYTYYGNKIAEATIYFDEKDRVTDVETSSKKEFKGIHVRRR
ncbi:MAG: hypothetical protein GXP25_01425 [Planctomycetes bacterium]|nr:hypothetical protein [Planctomycetota bacterium]